ncbi:MAG: 5-formyltetrahydrofolate cyclo-ligase [Tannerella sp.]|jgi:5-formyltetrahydrofolate cyclo-ligase|nr:5-formyltetrahydrofolate cyclo-ligase [Tannerella sp.]
MEAGDLSIEREKRLFRNEVALRKKQYTEEMIASKSELICKHLIGSSEFEHADRIAAYFSLPDEVQTLKMIEEWQDKKNIYLPVIEGNEMFFRKYNGANRLKTGTFGIKEPDEDSEKAAISDMDLFIVPGMAFDRNFNRLGRGKGFYDKILNNVRKPVIGLSFGFQLFDNIPANQHDIKMTEMITEDGKFL